MNHSMHSADWRTHVKILVVGLLFAGVVAAVGPNQEDLGKICGHTTARILKGAKPADLAIEHPAFDLFVNLKSAQRLGVVVPKRALEQAASVIR